MARISSQAQRAIDAMLAAGFKRSEFRVRTERVMEGGTFINRNGHTVRSYHYGDADISCWAPKAKQIDCTEAAIAAGLTVYEVGDAGYRFFSPTAYGKTPRLITWAAQLEEQRKAHVYLEELRERYGDEWLAEATA